jgi:hypothetical protein
VAEAAADGGGWVGVDAESPFSCAEAEGEKNGGWEKNWGPGALLMGEGRCPSSVWHGRRRSGGPASGTRVGVVEAASGQ